MGERKIVRRLQHGKIVWNTEAPFPMKPFCIMRQKIFCLCVCACLCKRERERRFGFLKVCILMLYKCIVVQMARLPSNSSSSADQYQTVIISKRPLFPHRCPVGLQGQQGGLEKHYDCIEWLDIDISRYYIIFKWPIVAQNAAHFPSLWNNCASLM